MRNLAEVLIAFIAYQFGQSDGGLFKDSFFVQSARGLSFLVCARLQRVKTVTVSKSNFVGAGKLNHAVQVAEGLTHVIERHIASRPLVKSKWRLFNVVCIGKRFGCIFVATRSH